MNYLVEISALLAVFCSIFLVLVPFVYLKRNGKVKVISDGTVVGGLGYVVNLGMILCGLLFFLFVYTQFDRSHNLSMLGIITLLISSTSLILGGIITKKYNRILHSQFINIAFSFFFVGSFIMGVGFREHYEGILILVLSFLGGVGALIFFVMKRLLTAQYWGILFINLLTIAMYFFYV